MARFRIAAKPIERLAPRWHEALYPALKRVPLARRAEVLRAARAAEVDAAERLGVIGSVAVAAYLLQSSPGVSTGWLAGTLMQFVLAWPVLAVLIAPWLIRRTRRAVQREASRFDGGDPCPESQAAAHASALRANPTQPRSTFTHSRKP